MRPVRLTMSAFGPYPGEETIDFRNLNNKNIFLITGPTGAGKTTIFDAISYVLFGEASGSSRDNDSLRSHFASLETITFVELEFELRGERYVIKRSPKQETKKSRGDGFRIKESDAEIVLPNGNIITKINNVDEKISSLLGINKNQFRQIVMLPQGEFRKLLEAESKEREVIFRKIFGTEAFQIIQQKLDSVQKDYYKKIREGETKRSAHIKHIEAGEDEVLRRLINAEHLNIIEIANRTREIIFNDQEESRKLIEDVKAIKQEQEKLQKNIIEGTEVNKKLQDKESQTNAYELQLSKEQEYIEKKLKLEKSRKALQVKPVEDALKDRKENVKLKENQYKEASQNLLKAEENMMLWENRFKAEENKVEERKGIAQAISVLKDKEEKVKSYEAKSLGILNLKGELLNKKNTLDKFKNDIIKEKENLNKANEKILFIKNCETERAELYSIRDEKNSTIEKMRDLRNKTRQYLSNVKQHESEANKFKEFEKEYLNIKSKYEQMEDSFLKGQAGILAKSLKDGVGCPVCGSIHHPKPAEVFSDAPTEEALKLEKLSFDRIREERNEKLQALSKLKGIIEESLKELAGAKNNLKSVLGESIAVMSDGEVLNFINDKGPKLKAELDELEAKIQKLNEEIEKKASVEAYLVKYQNDLETKEKLLPKLELDYTECYGKVMSEEEQLRSIEQEIPEETRSAVKLLEKIRELEKNLSILERAYENALKEVNDAKNLYAASKADKEAKLGSLMEMQAEVELWRNNLNKKIIDCGFKDYTDYVLFVTTEEVIEELDKDISNYYNKLQSLKDSLIKIKKDTEGLDRVSTEVFSRQLEELRLTEESLSQREKVIYSRIKNNTNVLNEIEYINNEIKEDEKKYTMVSDIAKAANGFNEERITFERYVLAAYFDEIINAANLRLNKMAAGRFILKRKDEKGKGTKQEGLELEVFDNYTGKSRHVRTLSGGEGFKASLALALGLADVVQSYAGGISLDTMFVDEGFGTLDPESLDNAIQCLIDLQKGGRMVGIISHVPELKERIDARLEITPAKEGSKTKFVV